MQTWSMSTMMKFHGCSLNNDPDVTSCNLNLIVPAEQVHKGTMKWAPYGGMCVVNINIVNPARYIDRS